MAATAYVLNNKPGNRTAHVLVNTPTAGGATITCAQLAIAATGETVTDYQISRVWWSGTWTITKGTVDVLYLDGAGGSGSTWDLSMAGMAINSATGGPGPVGADLTLTSSFSTPASILIELVKVSNFIPGT